MTCHPERITKRSRNTSIPICLARKIELVPQPCLFWQRGKKASDHMTCHFEGPPGIPTCVPSWINIVSVMCLDQIAPRVNTHFTPWCQPSSRPLNCMRSRLVAMGVAHGIRLYTFAGTAPCKCIKIIISRAASADTLACSLSTTSAMLSGTRCHFTTSQPRSVRHVVKRKQDTCGK